MDRLALAEADALTGHGDLLVAAADEMHFYAAFRLVPAGLVIEGTGIEIGAELAVDPGQEIEVEARGDTVLVVIGAQQRPCGP